MLKLFRKNLKPFMIPICFVLVFMFFQAMAELYLPTLMSDIINKGVVKSDVDYIWETGLDMLLIAAGSAICSIIGSFLSSRVAVGFGKNVRTKIFTRAETYSLNEFDKIGTDSLITRTTNDINQVQMALVMMMRFMISAPMMCIGGLILAVSKDKGLTWILVVSIPVLILSIAVVSMQAIPLFKSIQKKIDKVNLVVRENLIGIRVIRAFNRINSEKARFYDANKDLTDTSIRVNVIMAVLMPIIMLVMNLTTISIIWFGGIRIDNGTTQLGDMIAFMQYAMQIMFSVVMVAVMFVMIPRAGASAERINEVFDLEAEIIDPEYPKTANSERGYVEFNDVTFRYPGAEEPAISNISFSAKPGETTAIIGGTGSGKSTLVNLIPRFYDIDSGEILVDGVDIRKLTQKELRSKIGFVPQKAVLFTGSITDNLRYGKEDATEEEIKHAAEIAQATEFISEMKDGFDSEIAQGGNNVSGGQKQRLSIARALIRKPEIYVFDDSFSALDFKTDAKLRRAFKSETLDSTVLIVAQRVTTVMDADRIIVLEDGKVTGMGTHKELLNNCDVYREIVASQLSEEELA